VSAVRIEPLGDCALLVRCGEGIDAQTNTRALAIAAALRAADLPGLRDIAPAYASVCVHYDPVAWSNPDSAHSSYASIAQRLRILVDELRISTPILAPALIEIPVCYGGACGPDLDELAKRARLSAAEIVARHRTPEYRVAMLGFAPGFPYLLGLDPALHAPRRASPRTRVPAGSVAIGGAQTGIYPRELPGGWQIIARTPLCLFDPARTPPALLAPGQRVRFCPIDANEFMRLSI